MRPVECDGKFEKKLFIYNLKFSVLRGATYFKNGTLRFPRGAELKQDGTYRTCFGPCVAHNGVIYRDSDYNTAIALRRMTAVRKPEIPGFDQLLKNNQLAWFSAHQDVFNRLAELYTPYFEEYQGMAVEAMLHHDDPHDKKALRIQSWQDIYEDGIIAKDVWMVKPKVLYKQKKDEIIPPEKFPRMIGDLGCPASLQGIISTKLAKIAAAREPLYLNGGVIEFCMQSTPSRLAQVFDKIINPRSRYYFVYHSDDSCLSITIFGITFYFNVDISKCDASQGPAVFDALLRTTPEVAREDMGKIVEQCKLPIEIRSKADRKKKVKLLPNCPTVYSGVTITTFINGIASTSIGVTISEIVWEERVHTVEEVRRKIQQAIYTAGYIVTLEHASDYSRIQFLKYSPVYDIEGTLRPLLNLGVLLRMSGTCKGDVPGRGPLIPRFQQFQASLLAGAYPHAVFPLLNEMRAACGATPTAAATIAIRKLLKYKVHEEPSYPQYHVTEEEAFKRYRLNDLDTEELRTWGTLPCGYHQSAHFVDAILGLDYNLKSSSGLYATERDVIPFNEVFS